MVVRNNYTQMLINDVLGETLVNKDMYIVMNTKKF